MNREIAGEPGSIAVFLDRDGTSSGGALIDAYYYCPHHSEGEFGIDPSRSFVVGDRWLDIQLVRAVGAANWILGHTPAGKLEPNRSQTS
jgi:histidinol phosphatase-like enzyme